MSHLVTVPGIVASSNRQAFQCGSKRISRGIPGVSPFGHPKKNGGLPTVEVLNNVRGRALPHYGRHTSRWSRNWVVCSETPTLQTMAIPMHTERTVAHQKRTVFLTARSKGGKCYAALN